MHSEQAELHNHKAQLTSVGLFTAQVYGWMTLALGITATVALFFATAGARWFILNQELVLVVFLLQLFLVLGLATMLDRMNTAFAVGMFVLYSALMGFTLTGLLMIYTGASVVATLAVTAGTFATMSLLGMFTKYDLSRIGGWAIMGVVGLIFGTILNIFLRSSGLDMFLTYAGIFIFLILIAWDTQKIQHYAAVAEQNGAMTKYALMAALELYLDFINLFVRLLSLFGKRK